MLLKVQTMLEYEYEYAHIPIGQINKRFKSMTGHSKVHILQPTLVTTPYGPTLGFPHSS